MWKRICYSYEPRKASMISHVQIQHKPIWFPIQCLANSTIWSSYIVLLSYNANPYVKWLGNGHLILFIAKHSPSYRAQDLARKRFICSERLNFDIAKHSSSYRTQDLAVTSFICSNTAIKRKPLGPFRKYFWQLYFSLPYTSGGVVWNRVSWLTFKKSMLTWWKQIFRKLKIIEPLQRISCKIQRRLGNIV